VFSIIAFIILGLLSLLFGLPVTNIAIIAGLFGILFGFLLDRASERDNEKQTVATFLKLLYQELSEIREMPTDDTSRIYILYTDIWDSMVSSRILCLLEPYQVMKLSRLYKHIKGLSFEAEWFRQVYEEFLSIPESEFDKKYNFVGKRLNELGPYHLTNLKGLHKEIDDLFEKNWLIKKNLWKVVDK
jgi:hypothetical protein